MDMNRRFEGQVAVVTGGASGIGLGIGKRLAGEGATVILADVNNGTLTEAQKTLQTDGLVVETALLDVTDEAQVNSVLDGVIARHGRLDVMVNSAGIPGKTATKVVDYDLATFQRVLNINLTGSFIMTKAAIQRMLPRSYGRILLLASMGGKDGNPGMAGYASSKAGVFGLVKGIGKEYATSGITVNGIAPAVIATPLNANTAQEMLDYMTKLIPMGRLGTVEEVAALAAWIVSPEATFNTGFVFDLSGGRAVY
ncbi:MAG TPA: SDR family NAD(P)-dependent oxidoreductase [Phototrophicaceae bacterium]|nr:SDR family NAD(P)-dependent oxidoreductase [Phototrophicaceae bacterium]